MARLTNLVNWFHNWVRNRILKYYKAIQRQNNIKLDSRRRIDMPEYKGGYVNRAEKNLALYADRNAGEYLIYAALEYRCAIERLVFDYLTLVDANLPDDTEGLYRIVKMRGKILQIEPDFHHKIDFLNLYFRAIGSQQQFPKPDLDLLNSLHGRLGAFLHTINEPRGTIENPEWWNRLQQLLSQVREVMTPLANVPTVRYKMNDAGWKLFAEFKFRKKSEDEIIKVFQVSHMMRDLNKGARGDSQ
jgi:hypothetical protein